MTFQHACAIEAALRVAREPSLGILQLEGTDDVIDYEIIGKDGSKAEIVQAKSRESDAPWSPGELVEVVDRWALIRDAESTRFVFLTNGRSGPKLTRVSSALDGLRDGGGLDRHELAGFGSAPHKDAFLRRVYIRTNHPEVTELLARAELGVLDVLGGSRISGRGRATEIINGLLKMISLRAGDPVPSRRRITRTEILAEIGLTEESIDLSAPWTNEVAGKYSTAIRDSPRPPATIEFLSLKVSDLNEMELQEALNGRMTCPQSSGHFLRESFLCLGILGGRQATQ